MAARFGPFDPLAGHARPHRTSPTRSSPPSGRVSPSKAGVHGCSASRERDGNWGGGAWVRRSWASTMETLMLLRELGLDPASERARSAIGLVRDQSTWGPQLGDSPFFEGEVEPCINGRVLALWRVLRRGERPAGRSASRRAAGGWRLELRRSAEHAILVQLHDLRPRRTPGVREGEGRRVRREGGAPSGPGVPAGTPLVQVPVDRGGHRTRPEGSSRCWTRFSFPTRWHYDVLWGLDYLRRAGVRSDERTDEAIELVARSETRTGDGRSTSPTRARSTSTWKAGVERRAAGTRSVPCESWTGTRRKAEQAGSCGLQWPERRWQ